MGVNLFLRGGQRTTLESYLYVIFHFFNKRYIRLGKNIPFQNLIQCFLKKLLFDESALQFNFHVIVRWIAKIELILCFEKMSFFE